MRQEGPGLIVDIDVCLILLLWTRNYCHAPEIIIDIPNRLTINGKYSNMSASPGQEAFEETRSTTMKTPSTPSDEDCHGACEMSPVGAAQPEDPPVSGSANAHAAPMHPGQSPRVRQTSPVPSPAEESQPTAPRDTPQENKGLSSPPPQSSKPVESAEILTALD